MIEKKLTYTPNLAVHPGVTLKENLEFLKISNTELLTRTGISEKHISQILNGKASITADVAIKLEKATGISAEFLNNLQANYEIIVSKIKANEEISNEIAIAEKYNYSELASYDLVPKTKDKNEKTLELQRYFQVSSLLYVPNVSKVEFRNKAKSFNQESLTAWLRFGEIKAQELLSNIGSFDEKKLKENLEFMKSIMHKESFFSELQKLCFDCGVLLVHTPYFKNIKVNGAVRWYKDQPLIQINSKGSYCDIFWFTFFHEIGHILLHGKKNQFIDYDGSTKDDKENEADEFASNILIPKKEYLELLSKKVTLVDLNLFCKKIGINLGVLVGRFAHDGLISWPAAALHRVKINI